ncbi:hypothetical protein TYRP_022395 [Tyrophagus putrescentiae]|nr:hypothetical protein TYRP_022395 [Tyrophagus putrescentiae]
MGVCWSMKIDWGLSVTTFSEPPASRSRTLWWEFSERRLARTQPAAPAPTMISQVPRLKVTVVSADRCSMKDNQGITAGKVATKRLTGEMAMLILFC